MRIFQFNPNNREKSYETIPKDLIRWTGSHIVVHRDPAWGVEKAVYTATHIGTGRQIFPPTYNLDVLLSACYEVDAIDIDWLEVCKYARLQRLGDDLGIGEQSVAINSLHDAMYNAILKYRDGQNP